MCDALYFHPTPPLGKLWYVAIRVRCTSSARIDPPRALLKQMMRSRPCDQHRARDESSETRTLFTLVALHSRIEEHPIYSSLRSSLRAARAKDQILSLLGACNRWRTLCTDHHPRGVRKIPASRNHGPRRRPRLHPSTHRPHLVRSRLLHRRENDWMNSTSLSSMRFGIWLREPDL